MRSVQLRQVQFLLWLLFGLLDHDVARGSIAVSKCKNYARHIATYSNGRSQMPPDVVGEWTSSACEVIPGPQFLLRRLYITNRHWNGRFHHYSDGWCVQPTFTITIAGKYKLKGGSDRPKGAYISDFDFTNITLTPHSVPMLIKILSVAERHCPNAGLPILERERNEQALAPDMRNYSLLKDAYKKRECRELLGLHFYAFRLVKVITHYKRSHLLDELYFGEIPTHRARKTFIPSSFQIPLLRANAPSCDVCRLLRMSSSNFPPALSNERRIGTIKGEWVSNNCEVQSDMFLSRFLRFHGDPFENERKWELNYYYFSDPNCETISYIISASGNYSKDTPSSLIAGASDYAFTLTTLKITPMEKLIVAVLKSTDEGYCGVRSNWRVNEEQDVTSTGGCSAFELSLPSTDHDILKVSRRSDGGYELFTGQRPTGSSRSLSDKANRPQSFQVPLRMCRDVARGVIPLTTDKPTEDPSVGIKIEGFTIPPNLLPTKKTGNEVELRQVGDQYGGENGAECVGRKAYAALLSSVLVCFLLLIR